MGVSIYTKNKSIDLGCGGFNNLRTTVAYIVNKELGEFYEELNKGLSLFGDERKKFFEEYDKRLAHIDEELNIDPLILDFLYLPDCEGTLTSKHSRRLYEAIKDYDDDIFYGYVGRPDCAMFKDFKEIVKDSRDHRIKLYWS